jgi:hypothetical protein
MKTYTIEVEAGELSALLDPGIAPTDLITLDWDKKRDAWVCNDVSSCNGATIDAAIGWHIWERQTGLSWNDARDILREYAPQEEETGEPAEDWLLMDCPHLGEIVLKIIRTAHPVQIADGVYVINVTPHVITFADGDKLIYVSPSGIVINAKIEETEIRKSPGGVSFVRTQFVQNERDRRNLEALLTAYAAYNRTTSLIIAGSIIAAQAYPEMVAAMTPMPGFERVPPAEKRMNPHKFTVYCK